MDFFILVYLRITRKIENFYREITYSKMVGDVIAEEIEGLPMSYNELSSVSIHYVSTQFS